MRRRRTAIVLLGALVALLLVSCGGGEPTQSTSTGSEGGQRSQDGTRSHFEGGEKSVEEFGAEAGGDEREAVLAAEQAYLRAIAGRDFAKACSYLSASVTRSFERLAAPQPKAKGCSAILSSLLAPTASAISREQAEGRVAKVRVEDDQGFVIFHAPGARLYVFTMRREPAGWKAAALATSILVPLPAAGGG